jgi:RND family efflux transporter MFP subunit
MNQKLDLESAGISNEVSMPHRDRFSRVVRYVLPVLIVLAGVAVAWVMMTSSPRMERAAKPREARLVETFTITAGTKPLILTAWGEVKPAQEVSIKAQVSGVVETLLHSLEPGSFVAAGQPLLQLEKADYEAARAQRLAELDQARANLDIERGNQAVARSEFELLGVDVSGADKKLMLREPQLQSATAQVRAAEAALATADLNLKRTLIRAPFDGVIRERLINVGSHVAANADVVALTGSQSAWVEVSVPLNEVQWIRFPDANGEGGSTVTLHYDRVWTADQQREGRVLRLLSDLESSGRMARILVQVDDPLALALPQQSQPPLLMGSFVRAQVQGKALESVVVIPAVLLHDNDTVWLYADDKLQIRPVEVLYRNQQHVYVRSGLQPGDQLVASALSTATDGMPLRVKADQSESTP